MRFQDIPQFPKAGYQELGEKANGTSAKLRIVEIPDGTSYTIDEYNGLETIHEAHQSTP